jgi:fructose-1,6-bisphosphatase/inositol monophosphatase family enzyme
VAEGRARTELLDEHERVWLVDPLDGTSDFVAGSPDFAVMVALVQRGVTVASVIHQPLTDTTYSAELRAGAYRDGTRLSLAPAPCELLALRGAVLSRFLSHEQQDRVRDSAPRFASLGAGRMCAGAEYPLLADGAQDFAVFWRTLPWDHAPGGPARHRSGRQRAAPRRAGVPASLPP